MKKFEYLMYDPFVYGSTIGTNANDLNAIGKEGWEMVGCGSPIDGLGHIIYFKREII